MKKDKTEIIQGKEYKKEVYEKAPKGAEVYEVKIIQSIEYYCSVVISFQFSTFVIASTTMIKISNGDARCN